MGRLAQPKHQQATRSNAFWLGESFTGHARPQVSALAYSKWGFDETNAFEQAYEGGLGAADGSRGWCGHFHAPLYTLFVTLHTRQTGA
jgi:hypothetical protein